MMGWGHILGRGLAMAFFWFAAKFNTGMYNTDHVLDRSMESFEPLDSQKWMAGIELGVPQKNSN
jgi:hypothetical protein